MDLLQLLYRVQNQSRKLWIPARRLSDSRRMVKWKGEVLAVLRYYRDIWLEGVRTCHAKISLRIVGVPLEIQKQHSPKTRQQCHDHKELGKMSLCLTKHYIITPRLLYPCTRTLKTEAVYFSATLITSYKLSQKNTLLVLTVLKSIK
jgi:hypothetical protein